MPVDVKIIVTDAQPLIALAAANCLDYLLFPALPVIIPDAVFFEATNVAGKLGAQEILDWYRAHWMPYAWSPPRPLRQRNWSRGSRGERVI